MGKLRVAVVFGGRSGEHEVSLMSAKSIMDAIDKERYEVIPVGITKEGRWLVGGDPLRALMEGRREDSALGPGALLPTGGGPPAPSSAAEASGPLALAASADIFFPVLHGPYGEDGTIQGLFDLAGVPYVGAGVAASAVGMDKAFMKMAFQHAGLPVLDYVVFTEVQWAADAVGLRDRVGRELGYPCFVKPANLGSSVGISRVAWRGTSWTAPWRKRCATTAKSSWNGPRQDCREVEVSVLGNDDPQASIPGEIVPANDFYDYEAKYLSDESELHYSRAASAKPPRNKCAKWPWPRFRRWTPADWPGSTFLCTRRRRPSG